MINEEIIGGLVSALSRGESLENAMMTFYNAGYKKDEIEDSAREVYNQVGPQMMGIKGSLQDTLNDIAVKAGVPITPAEKPVEQSKDNLQGKIVLQTPTNAGAPVTKEQPVGSPKNNTPEKIMLQTADDKKPSEANNLNKEEDKSKQNFTGYVNTTFGGYQNANDITNKIEEAIKGLRPVNIPSRIEIVHKNIDVNSPTVVQHVSDYSESSQKSVNKTVTYILIAILILLLMALGAIILFKEDLITLFNNLGIA